MYPVQAEFTTNSKEEQRTCNPWRVNMTFNPESLESNSWIMWSKKPCFFSDWKNLFEFSVVWKVLSELFFNWIPWSMYDWIFFSFSLQCVRLTTTWTLARWHAILVRLRERRRVCRLGLETVSDKSFVVSIRTSTVSLSQDSSRCHQGWPDRGG